LQPSVEEFTALTKFLEGGSVEENVETPLNPRPPPRNLLLANVDSVPRLSTSGTQSKASFPQTLAVSLGAVSSTRGATTPLALPRDPREENDPNAASRFDQ
jgi:hypothetical protein